jgi:hypothetical protein
MKFIIGEKVDFYFEDEVLCDGEIISLEYKMSGTYYHISHKNYCYFISENAIFKRETKREYDFRGLNSSDVYQRIHGISMYGNNKVILEQNQITTEIITLANARGVGIEVKKPIEIQTVTNGDFISDVWDWSFPELWIDAKKQKPYVTYGANGDFSSDIWTWSFAEEIDKIIKDLKEAKKTDMLLFPNYEFALKDDVKNKLKEIKSPYYSNLPDTVYFNDKKKATTLMYNQKATVVKCGKGDKYSRRIGFLEAYFQSTCGLSKTQAKKYLENIVKDKEEKK